MPDRSSVRCRSHKVKPLIEITEAAGGNVVVATLNGDIDLVQVPLLRWRLESSLVRSVAGLVIDLTGIRYFDSSGVGLLFEMKKRLQHTHRRLSVVAADGAPIHRILSIVNIDRYITMRPTLAAALADFDGRPEASP